MDNILKCYILNKLNKLKNLNINVKTLCSLENVKQYYYNKYEFTQIYDIKFKTSDYYEFIFNDDDIVKSLIDNNISIKNNENNSLLHYIFMKI